MLHNISAGYTHAALVGLLSDLATWSQATFGCDAEHGPIPPLKHMKKEIDELLANIDDRMEWADIFLLFFDALRRHRIGLIEILDAAKKKLEICKTRKWPEPMKWAYVFGWTGEGISICTASNGNPRDTIVTYGSTPLEAKAKAQEIIRTWDLEPHEHDRSTDTPNLPSNHV